ncbi:ATP-dependent helicase [Gorillibacterium sp. CAU 1737]|uniref:ATP-dependent helicase n=1 Tax=Gorillibacterium sp. CAU 1737 TaxID=3140362 RepID=UPI003260016D
MNESAYWARLNKAGVVLNDVQKQAVLQSEGPLLLLAVPGSGKTTTLISRIGYLTQVKGVNPKRMLAVTFSRAAARDMRERFERFFPEMEMPNFSTLHSLAFGILRQDFWRRGEPFQSLEGERRGGSEAQEEAEGDVLPDSLEPGLPQMLTKRMILKELYRSHVRELPTEDQLEDLETYITCVKNKTLPGERWAKVDAPFPHAEKLLDAYETYKRESPNGRLIDFDDMLVLALEALQRDKGLLKAYQGRYDYILTDESQDTSLVQHAIIAWLAEKHGNLCVVADDDQSIYAWRGAEPRYLLNFRGEYPGAKLLYMEQNYRSSREIVEAANAFIGRNKQRYPKKMNTLNPVGEPLVFHRFGDYRMQMTYLVEQLSKTSDLSETAVLFRTNTSSIPLMNRLDRAGIPFYMKDVDNRFFSHWVVEDILNFMRLTFTEKRVELLERLVSKMNGYLSRAQVEALKELDIGESMFDALLASSLLADYQVKPLTESRDTLRSLKGAPPLAVIRSVREELGYDKALDKLSERRGYNMDYISGILDALEDIAEPLLTMEEFAERLAYLRTVPRKPRPKKDQPAVTLSTFHSAKGLEFERVYLIDLVEGIVPDERDDTEEKMEEAVRLFYVGMTRAKRKLTLISYGKKDKKDLVESRFMKAVRRIVNPQEAGDGASTPRGARSGGTGGGTGRTGRQQGGGRKEWTAAPSRSGSSTAKAARSSAPLTPVRSKYYDPAYQAEVPFLKEGETVQHSVIGRGIIRKLEGDRIEIEFKSGNRAFSIGACLEMNLLKGV